MAAPISRCCARLSSVTLSFPAAGYHARPRVWGLGGVYKPDPQDDKTKEWHKGPKYEAKLYGRHGEASGVDPAQLWPSPEQLRGIEEEEKEWYPTLQEMLDRLEAKEMEQEKQKKARDSLIAANMAKMPQMVADWRRQRREKREKEQAEKARSERLLAQAREKFGLHVDYRSPKFQEMVKELEKEEKKKRKLLKKQKREDTVLARTTSAGGADSNGTQTASAEAGETSTVSTEGDGTASASTQAGGNPGP